MGENRRAEICVLLRNKYKSDKFIYRFLRDEGGLERLHERLVSIRRLLKSKILSFVANPFHEKYNGGKILGLPSPKKKALENNPIEFH